ncbi:MAG: Ig-like domain-containing protein [Candidatus Bathyarchaeia archaeon]
MTGVIVLASTGLILAENCESYLNSWTFSISGTTTALGSKIGKAHSGAGAFQLETLSSWPSGAYSRFTKSVAVGSGANRVTRLFRGPGYVASIMDDFPGSGSLDATKWNGGGTCTVANSICSIPAGASFTTQAAFQLPPSVYYNSFVCCKADSPIQGTVSVYLATDAVSAIAIQFNTDGTGHVKLYTNSSGLATTTDCGAIVAGYHNYLVAWTAGNVKLYRDNVQIGTCSDSSVPAPDTFPANVGFTNNAGTFLVDSFGYVTGTNMWKVSYAIGSQTIFDQDVQTEARSLDNGFFDSGWVAVTPTGTQTLELKLRNASAGADNRSAQCTWDDLIIMLDKVITINALLGGQKVEIYNAGGGLVGTGTCPAPGSAVTIDVSAQVTTAYGFSGYFKVYDTDGTTLLYTGTTIILWGGDIYTWIPNQSSQAISADNTLIYRAGSGLSPATALVTVTLTDLDTGSPLSGKAIAFTPNLGTCSPTSGTTDSNGQLQTTFTPGSSPGLGGVQAVFGGDATYAPSNSQQLIDIYYAQVAPDSSKDYQVFIAGQEVVSSGGSYVLSSDFKPQPFSITTPQMGTSLGGWWAVEIYRLGVKEFAGRIMHRKRVSGATPLLTFDGVSEVITLQRRIVNRTYLDDPKNIITDLLSRFPCGITAGTISLFGSNIKLVASYESLYDALIQVQNATGWLFRLNADKTLDFAPSFGAAKAITILEGNQETESTHEEDWSQLDTSVYAIGAGASASLVAAATNLTTQLLYGLIEEAFPAKNITDAGTLSLRAQALLAQKQNLRETIDVKWIDDYVSGSYAPFDTVTVTDADTGLSGIYVIYMLTRDLLDAKSAEFSLTNRPLTLADAVQLIRTIVKDLAVA